MNIARTIALLAALSLTTTAAAEDDWLGSQEPGSWLSIAAGADEDEGRALQLLADLPFVGQGRSYLGFERAEYAPDQQSRAFSVGIGSDPYADTVVRLDGKWREQEHAAEFRDLQLGLTHYSGPWDVSFQGLIGRVQLTYETEPTLFTPASRTTETIGRYGYGVGIGRRLGPVRIAIDAQDYAYDESPGRVDGGFALPLLAAPRTPSNQATIPDWEGTAGLSVVAGAWDAQLAYQRSVSALDRTRIDSASVGLGYLLKAGHRLGLRVDAPVENGAVFGQLVIGIQL